MAQSKALTNVFRLRDIVSVKSPQFNVKGDGTDETAGLEAAIGYCKGVAGYDLYFPSGTYGFSESTPNFGLYINAAITIRGAGETRTTLKNLSATGAGIRCANGYQDISGFTLDNNNSTGIAFRQGGQHSKTHDIQIKNQAGAATYAFVIDGSTLADIENVKLSACSNGIDIGPTAPTNYVNFRQVTIEQGAGKALRATTGSGCRFYGLHIENQDLAVAVEKFMYIDNCQQMDFFNFTCETGASHTLSDAAYFQINDSRSINFWGGRISHLGTVSKSIFLFSGTTNQNVNIAGFDIISTKTGMVMFENAGTIYGLNISNIRTVLTSAATGLKCTSAVNGGSLINWTDNNAVSSHTLGGPDLFVSNVLGDIAVTTAARQIFINCSGAFSGTGALVATIINTDHQSSGKPTFASNSAIPAGGTTGLGYKFSTTANFGVFFGSGSPTLTAAKGSLYLRSDGSGVGDRMYVNTDGGTTWTAVTTAA